MLVTKADVAAARRALFTQPRNVSRIDHPDFKVRAISEEWRILDRTPAYKTAKANVAYIWRDDSVSDRFGPMPVQFSERRCELRGAGLILPASAPDWAIDGYRIWDDADEATAATGDPTAVAAWHVMMEIPLTIDAGRWAWLATGFIQQELARRGAAVAWAIHALKADDGSWFIAPHAHLVVTARYWRHDRRQGARHPAWIGSWAAQKRLEMAWHRRCSTTRLISFAGFG